MEIDVLRELQERGRFFWEMFPGAKASDEWQQQRERLERLEETSGEQRSSLVRYGRAEEQAENRELTLTGRAVLYAIGLDPTTHDETAIEPSRPRLTAAGRTFRLQANMRRGTGSSLRGTGRDITRSTLPRRLLELTGKEHDCAVRVDPIHRGHAVSCRRSHKINDS